MRIGIIGAGNMARALGGRWSGTGHDVMVSGRDRDATETVASTLGSGVRGGTFQEAAEVGDVTLVAISADAVSEVEAVAALGIRLLVKGIGLESVLPFDQPRPV